VASSMERHNSSKKFTFSLYSRYCCSTF